MASSPTPKRSSTLIRASRPRLTRARPAFNARHTGIDVEPRRVVVAADDVGTTLADDVAGDVVAVARTDCRRSARRHSSGPSSRAPTASDRTASRRVDHLQGIDAKRPASVRSGDRVELFGGERPEAGVQVARVIQDDDTLPWRGADSAHEVGPTGNIGVRGLRAGGERKGVEVPGLGCDLVADDRREVSGDPHPIGRRTQVERQVVVIGGDRQLDPLASQCDRPLVERGVAVPAMGQGVNVRVAGDQSVGRDLAADGQVQAPIWPSVRLTSRVSTPYSNPRVAETT